MKKIKVLIIDDSAVVRRALHYIFSSDRQLEVMPTASDPFAAAKIIKNEIPDVITLDIEMPRMDGITFLQKLMAQYPVPVIVISTLTEKGTATALKAIDLGAIEVLAKPKLDTKHKLHDSKIQLCDIVKAAAKAKVSRLRSSKLPPPKKQSADAILRAADSHNSSMIKTTEKIVVVGASTGGTTALKNFLEAMPLNCPGIVIVQHMPEVFTTQFAKRLDESCRISVAEAKNGDRILPGQALIAPGDKHMSIIRSGAQYHTKIQNGPLVNRHKPSVDVLFRSAAKFAGNNSIGVLMTGMGDDGARGLLEMKENGSHTIAQDEKSCVVFGMPREAILRNAHTQILPLDQIAAQVLRKAEVVYKNF